MPGAVAVGAVTGAGSGLVIISAEVMTGAEFGVVDGAELSGAPTEMSQRWPG